MRDYALEKWLVQMHHSKQEPEFTLCPARFEEDFQREFGSGDEQPINYEPLDHDMIDAGHKPEDFA